MKNRKKLQKMYKQVTYDHFPEKMEITFVEDQNRQTLFYEKVTWTIQNDRKGLRYGENPNQEAAFYRLINGNLYLGDVQTIAPGEYLCSDIQLIQSGKHPGKINITDVDSGLNILRYFSDSPCCVIIKHNNPCGVALGNTLLDAYEKAFNADRIAAFGGAVVVNKAVDKETAQLIKEHYCEVVAAPGFEEGAVGIFKKRKNLRLMQIKNIERLHDFVGKPYVDFRSLIDGGLIAQWSYTPMVRTKEDFIFASAEKDGKTYAINREPTESEYQDFIFGWLVESGITSNSVMYVKNNITLGIGTGEQDRVGVAEIARDKTYRKYHEQLAWESHKTPYHLLTEEKKNEIQGKTEKDNAGLHGSVMISDGFFPFRDGVDVGLREGVTGVVQPGGSLRDFESIQACNEYHATMVYTGERSFRH